MSHDMGQPYDHKISSQDTRNVMGAWEANYEKLSFIRRGRILTIVMNDPERLNAVGLQMHDELAQVFYDVAADDGSDVVVLTGAGTAFSAGGDLSHMQAVVDDPELFLHEAAMARRIVHSLLDLEKPIISKVNGHAIGLGATLALLCDLSFVSSDAKIGDPHVKVGLVAGDGGAAIWPQLIGFARAKEFLLTGDLLDAEKAERLGLVNHVLPPDKLDAAVDDFCDRLANGSTKAICWTKATVNIELKRIAQAAMDAGITYETLTAGSPDHAEGVKAFKEKRKPVFERK